MRALDASGAAGSRLALAEHVEKAALDILHKEKPGRPLDTNVEFYTAVLLDALGFPADSFTCVFVAGRMPGWIAHAREQEAERPADPPAIALCRAGAPAGRVNQ